MDFRKELNVSEASFNTQLATVDEQRICLLHGYRLTNNFLGEGFDGRVFVAHPTIKKIAESEKLRLLKANTNDLKVAIKIIYANRGLHHMQHLVDNLPNEIRIMSEEFGHSSVIMLLDVFIAMQRIFLVVEAAVHGTLSDVFRGYHYYSGQDCLEEWQARPYFQLLMAGMEHLHSQGVTHRDVKLENVFITDNVHLKFGDFGLATLEESIPAEGLLNGTPCYMAPELFLNQPCKSKPTDIWSAGILLYLLIHGDVPFNCNDFKEADRIFRNVNLTIYIKDTLSQDCRDLLGKLLERDPERRITAPEAMQHPWMMGPCHDIGYRPTTPIESSVLNKLRNESEWKARQEEVHNYLFQRVKILCDLTEFIRSYHEWQDVREFGVNIDHFREDAGDTPIPEVWRLEAVEYAKRRRPMLINPFSAGGGTGLKCEWAPRSPPLTSIYAPVYRIIIDHEIPQCTIRRQTFFGAADLDNFDTDSESNVTGSEAKKEKMERRLRDLFAFFETIETPNADPQSFEAVDNQPCSPTAPPSSDDSCVGHLVKINKVSGRDRSSPVFPANPAAGTLSGNASEEPINRVVVQANGGMVGFGMQQFVESSAGIPNSSRKISEGSSFGISMLEHATGSAVSVTSSETTDTTPESTRIKRGKFDYSAAVSTAGLFQLSSGSQPVVSFHIVRNLKVANERNLLLNLPECFQSRTDSFVVESKSLATNTTRAASTSKIFEIPSTESPKEIFNRIPSVACAKKRALRRVSPVLFHNKEPNVMLKDEHSLSGLSSADSSTEFLTITRAELNADAWSNAFQKETAQGFGSASVSPRALYHKVKNAGLNVALHAPLNSALVCSGSLGGDSSESEDESDFDSDATSSDTSSLHRAGISSCPNGNVNSDGEPNCYSKKLPLDPCAVPGATGSGCNGQDSVDSDDESDFDAKVATFDVCPAPDAAGLSFFASADSDDESNVDCTFASHATDGLIDNGGADSLQVPIVCAPQAIGPFRHFRPTKFGAVCDIGIAAAFSSTNEVVQLSANSTLQSSGGDNCCTRADQGANSPPSARLNADDPMVSSSPKKQKLPWRKRVLACFAGRKMNKSQSTFPNDFLNPSDGEEAGTSSEPHAYIDKADSPTNVVRAPNHDGDTTPYKKRWWKSNRGKKGRNSKPKGGKETQEKKKKNKVLSLLCCLACWKKPQPDLDTISIGSTEAAIPASGDNSHPLMMLKVLNAVEKAPKSQSERESSSSTRNCNEALCSVTSQLAQGALSTDESDAERTIHAFAEKAPAVKSVCGFARNSRSSLSSLGGAGMEIVVDMHMQESAANWQRRSLP